MLKTSSEKILSAFPPCRKPAGFTLVEIIIAIAIIAILTAIARPVYIGYIDKAKRTKGISTLETVRKSFEDYHINNGGYPPGLDVATGEDGEGRTVLNPAVLAEFNTNLSSLESYTLGPGIEDYTLKARAIDIQHTLLVLNAGTVVTQGP